MILFLLLLSLALNPFYEKYSPLYGRLQISEPSRVTSFAQNSQNPQNEIVTLLSFSDLSLLTLKGLKSQALFEKNIRTIYL